MTPKAKGVAIKALAVLALALVCVAAHSCLVPAYVGFLNADADYAVYPLTSEWMRLGHWAPFQIGFNYGGSGLTYLRVLWVGLYESLFVGPEAFLVAHSTFTFYVVPLLLTFSFYFMFSSYVSALPAFLTALLCAVGFHSWVFMMGIEFYNSYLIAGSILLGLRARYVNPTLQMRLPTLFWTSLLGGFAYYCCRASIVYLVAFFLPIEWAWKTLKAQFRPRARDQVEKILIPVVIFLLGLFAYLEVFGADVGMIGGKAVRIHAHPNLEYALMLLGFLWVRRTRSSWKPQAVRRVAVCGLGFLVGFSPELIYWLSRGSLPPLSGQGTYGFEDSFRAAGRIPSTIVTLFSASEASFTKHAILALLILGTISLWQRLKTKPGLPAVALAGGLALFAYVRVFTYDLAPARYLLPLFPTALLAVSLALESALKRRVAYGVLLTGLMATSAWGQHYKYAFDSQTLQTNGAPEQIREVIRVFRASGVHEVVTDDYWKANQFSVVARLDPVFVAHPSGFMLPDATTRALQASQVGLLLSKVAPSGDLVSIAGATWRLKPLAEVGKLRLFLGTRQ